MDPAPPVTIDSLQARVVELEKEVAVLSGQNKSLIVFATHILRALGQQRHVLSPQGCWIRAWHLPFLQNQFKSLKKLETSPGIAKMTWTWLQFPKMLKGRLPAFPNREFLWTKRRLDDYKVVPFRQSLPLELFEAIVSVADIATLSRAARASFACYQLFMPLVLERTYALDKKRLQKIFAVADTTLPKSLRLDWAHSFRHVRSLLLGSTALVGCDDPFPFDFTRLPAGSSTLDLDVLTILIDTKRTDEDGLLVEVLPAESEAFFAHLNPRKLIVCVDHDEIDTSRQTTYIAHRDASIAISRWTRLKVVQLEDVNLLSSFDEDDDEIEDESDGVFFLSQRGVELTTPGEVDIIWDLSAFLSSTPRLGYLHLVDLLLHRDRVLREPWIKSFTVIVRNEKIGQSFQKLIDEANVAGGDVPSTLRWRIVGADEDVQLRVRR